MNGRNQLLVILSILLAYPVLAQTEENSNSVLQVPIYFSEINPENALGILTLDLPFHFPGENQAKNQFSFGYSMGNTWHPQTRFVYPENLTPKQREQLRDIHMTLRPQYFAVFDIDTKEKLYQSDGVLQHFRFSWIRQWKNRNSLIVNMNAHMLNGGKSPVNFFVSDWFIENFHTQFAVDDNYGRRLFPFNRASVQFTDEQGHTYRKDKGDVFTGVFDLHYYRRLFRSQSSGWRFDSQLASHLSLPLNDFHRYIVPGISAGFRIDRRLGTNSSVTFATDGGITDQQFLKISREINGIDWRYRKHAKAYLGFNFISPRNKITTIGILNNFQDPLLKGYSFSGSLTDYETIGLKYLDEGDTWEGEPVSQEFWLTNLTPKSLYYYSVKSYIVLGFHHKNREFTFYVGEDIISINNAPDFQIGVQYRISLKDKK